MREAVTLLHRQVQPGVGAVEFARRGVRHSGNVSRFTHPSCN